MKFYCANCGMQLKHTRKALPNLGVIIDLIAYHECPGEILPLEIDPKIVVEAPPVEGKDKFVKSLNDLKQTKNIFRVRSEGDAMKRSSMTGTDDLRDRRFHQGPEVHSSAPPNVLDQVNSTDKHISNPEHDLGDDNFNPEMEG